MNSITAYLPDLKLRNDGSLSGFVRGLPIARSVGGELVYSVIQKLFGSTNYVTKHPSLEQMFEVELNAHGLQGRTVCSISHNNRVDYVKLEIRRQFSENVYVVDAETMSLTRQPIFLKKRGKILKTLEYSPFEQISEKTQELLAYLENLIC